MKTGVRFWVFQIALLAALLILVEIILRAMGYMPGDMKPKWLNFKPVDSLYIIPDFQTNANGILVANQDYFKSMGVEVNSDGFRDKDFTTLDSNKKKILLLGDSFTWGMSAQPLDSSFADILQHETEYEIVNTGIPAADPPQYLEVAKQLIPQLKPDLVVVMFFMGNDLMKQDRKAIPNEPFYYYTNAGAILADIDGIHFKSAQAAYNYFVNDKYYLKQPRNIFETVVSKSALLSRLYSVKFRVEEKIEYERMVKDTYITKKYLNQIAGLCDEGKGKMVLVMIPEIKEAEMNQEDFKEKYSNLLADSTLQDKWHIPVTDKMFFNEYPDAHLNNTGHRFYAEYLKLLIRNSLANK